MAMSTEAIRDMTAERQRAEKALGTDRDSLAQILRVGHRSIIVWADEWRPLADNVLDLVVLALRNTRGEQPE